MSYLSSTRQKLRRLNTHQRREQQKRVASLRSLYFSSDLARLTPDNPDLG